MYVVSDNIPNVQKNWNWLNSFLKILKKSKKTNQNRRYTDQTAQLKNTKEFFETLEYII